MVCNILELNASDHLGYEMKPILYRLSDLSTTFQFLSFLRTPLNSYDS